MEVNSNPKYPKYANTPMSEEMFKWVTDAAWKRKITRSEYIRRLIQQEMDFEKAWSSFKDAEKPLFMRQASKQPD